MKTKILICGGTGFIGRNFIESWSLRDDVECHAVFHKKLPFSCPNVIWHHADLRKQTDVNRVVRGMDIIIQAAANTSGVKDIVLNPEIHITDNIVMNAYLCQAAFQAKVKHLIFFSCTVMYHSSKNPLRESDFNPTADLHPNYFGIANTKLYIEKMCEFYANISDTRFTAIRHSNIYGPHDKFDLEHSHVFGATITKVMQATHKMKMWGTGQEQRDLLYIDDLINFVQLVIENQSQKYRIYNCGSGQAVAINSLVNKIVEHAGKQLYIEHDLSKPTIPTSFCLDCTLAKKELGWQVETDLDMGIKKTLAWWHEQVQPAATESI